MVTANGGITNATADITRAAMGETALMTPAQSR